MSGIDNERNRSERLRQEIAAKWTQKNKFLALPLPVAYHTDMQGTMSVTEMQPVSVSLKNGGELSFSFITTDQPSIPLAKLVLQLSIKTSPTTSVDYPAVKFTSSQDIIEVVDGDLDALTRNALLNFLAEFSPESIDSSSLVLTDKIIDAVLDELGFMPTAETVPQAISLTDWQALQSTGFETTGWDQQEINRQRLLTLFTVIDSSEIKQLFLDSELQQYFGVHVNELLESTLQFLELGAGIVGNLGVSRSIVNFRSVDEKGVEIARKLTDDEVSSIVQFITDFELAEISRGTNKLPQSFRIKLEIDDILEGKTDNSLREITIKSNNLVRRKLSSFKKPPMVTIIEKAVAKVDAKPKLEPKFLSPETQAAIKEKWSKNRTLIYHEVLPVLFTGAKNNDIFTPTSITVEQTNQSGFVLPLKNGTNLKLGLVEFIPSSKDSTFIHKQLAIVTELISDNGTVLSYPPFTFSIFDLPLSLGKTLTPEEQNQLVIFLSEFDSSFIDLEKLDITDYNTARIISSLGFKASAETIPQANTISEWEQLVASNFEGKSWDQHEINKQRLLTLLILTSPTEFSKLFSQEELKQYLGNNYIEMLEIVMKFISQGDSGNVIDLALLFPFKIADANILIDLTSVQVQQIINFITTFELAVITTPRVPSDITQDSYSYYDPAVLADLDQFSNDQLIVNTLLQKKIVSLMPNRFGL